MTSESTSTYSRVQYRPIGATSNISLTFCNLRWDQNPNNLHWLSPTPEHRYSEKVVDHCAWCDTVFIVECGSLVNLGTTTGENLGRDSIQSCAAEQGRGWATRGFPLGIQKARPEVRDEWNQWRTILGLSVCQEKKGVSKRSASLGD